MVWLGWGQTQDTRHTWTTVTDGRVPETLGRSHPSANKDAPTARKIEYKNFIQEIEGAHTDVTWPGVFRAFFSLKMTLLYFGKSLSWEPCSGLLGSAAIFFFFFWLFFYLKGEEKAQGPSGFNLLAPNISQPLLGGEALFPVQTGRVSWSWEGKPGTGRGQHLPR